MNIKDAKNIYCLGIGGIGVSGIARLLKAQGKNVMGSDMRQSKVTDDLIKLGITVRIGHDASHVLEFLPDILIYSQDISPGSAGYIEIDQADTLGIAKITQGQALGELMADKYGIGVTGTNGKSTTTAILGLILQEAGLDPTVLIGSLLSPKNETEKFKANARLGDGKYFVAESDEYARKMLENKPKMIVLTNIALDHLDYYKNLDDIQAAFLEYVKSLPEDGILIFNADDHNSCEVCKHAKCHKFTFGIHHYADLQAINPAYAEASDMSLLGLSPSIMLSGKQVFDMHYDDQMIGKFELQVPGLFNISNALGAALAAIKLGVKIEVIQKVLKEYAGIWRRFEIVGQLEGKTVISDYAHHPAGIEATIQAAKEFYPGKKILVVFQPHHHNRTEKLFDDFVNSLVKTDEVIVPEIFDVAGREHGEIISSKQIVQELQKNGAIATYAENLAATELLIREKIKNFDLVLMMGAGDIDTLARKLVE